MVSSDVKQQCFSRSENRENNKLMDGDGWRELWRKILTENLPLLWNSQ